MNNMRTAIAVTMFLNCFLSSEFLSGSERLNTKMFASGLQNDDIKFDDLGIGVHHFLFANKKIKISFESEICSPTPVSDEFQYAFGIVPDVIAKKIKWIKILVNNDIVVFPRTAYDRLYQIKIIEFLPTGNGFKMTFYGGDGGDAYVCKFYFDNRRLKKREIHSLETVFPKAMETTIYRDDELEKKKK